MAWRTLVRGLPVGRQVCGVCGVHCESCPVAGIPGRSMTYVLELPDLPYPSLNTRRDKRWDGPKIKAWREAAAWSAVAQKLPRLVCPKVRLHFYPGDLRHRDRINLALVHKAVVDGLVDAGVLFDDTPEFVDELMPQIHRGKGVRRWELVLEPCDVEGAA